MGQYGPLRDNSPRNGGILARPVETRAAACTSSGRGAMESQARSP